MKLKKKIFTVIVFSFGLYILTCLLWSDKRLVKHGLEVIESQQDCAPDSVSYYKFKEIIYKSDLLTEEQRIEVDDRSFFIEDISFEDLIDSSVVYLITNEFNGFFLRGVRVECTESVNMHLYTYYGEVVIWRFFDWVKLFDEKDLERWVFQN